ncbi:MAG: flavin reductase family protein [Pirellula sp.]|nr:flavin reductase family protein [Pirellula sp.]
MMQFDFKSLDATSRYKMMTGLIVPRPIAWITTVNVDGSNNAAPFSFFNAIGTDPALIVVGIGDHPDRPKDTAVNIQREKEFVVNLVPEALAQSMSDSATDYPAHVSEIDILELATLSSTWVKPPRLAGCPASLECRLERVLMIGENRIIFGEVLGVHVLDDVVSDASKCQIASEQMQLIGRMGGLGGYTRTTDIFQIPRKKHTGS